MSKLLEDYRRGIKFISLKLPEKWAGSVAFWRRILNCEGLRTVFHPSSVWGIDDMVKLVWSFNEYLINNDKILKYAL